MEEKTIQTFVICRMGEHLSMTLLLVKCQMMFTELKALLIKNGIKILCNINF